MENEGRLLGEAGSDKVSVCSGRTWSLANPEPLSVQGPPRQRAGNEMGCSLLPQSPPSWLGSSSPWSPAPPTFPPECQEVQPWGGVTLNPQQAQLLLMSSSHISLSGPCGSVFCTPAHATPTEVLPLPKGWDFGEEVAGCPALPHIPFFLVYQLQSPRRHRSYLGLKVTWFL